MFNLTIVRHRIVFVSDRANTELDYNMIFMELVDTKKNLIKKEKRGMIFYKLSDFLMMENTCSLFVKLYMELCHHHQSLQKYVSSGSGGGNYKRAAWCNIWKK